MRKAIITCDFCGNEIVTGKVGKTWHTITWHGGVTKMSKDICGECWDERLLAIKKEEDGEKEHSADVVEVVRCKDCIHSRTANFFRGFGCWLTLDGEGNPRIINDGDGYCWRGEK